MESAGVSSMMMLLSANCEAARVICWKSPLLRNCPDMSERMLIRARAQMRRCTRESAVISSEKTAQAFFCSTATCSMMFMASEVLPIEGRAAMMIISPGCIPPVISSRRWRPVGRPLMALGLAASFSRSSMALKTRSFMVSVPFLASSPSRMPRILDSTSSRRGPTFSWSSKARPMHSEQALMMLRRMAFCCTWSA